MKNYWDGNEPAKGPIGMSGIENKLSPESALAEIISVLGQIPLTKDQHKYLDLCLSILIGVIHQEAKDA